MKRIRVLLVEDSRTVLERLRGIIDADHRLQVVGAVATGEEALRIVHSLAPDVISMDVRLPGMNGLEATQRIMSEKPTPIVVVSASVATEDLNISINALKAGALAVVEKPTGATHADYISMGVHLCTQLVIMSEVHVVRQRTCPPLPMALPPLERRPMPLPGATFSMVAMVASTGGPTALSRILGALDPVFPVPLLLVQHITSAFLPGFVTWLQGQCRLPVAQARAGLVPVAGTVYVAPADRHLCLEGACMDLKNTPEVDGQRPSGTVLFESLARSLGPRSIGVLLTGMGADGADGLLAMRRAGAYTVAEDASTAVVYGMPAEAVQRGAVCESLPLHGISDRLLTLLRQGRH